MQYTSQKAQFGSYRNGLDGVSFVGITEYYYATLATDVDGEIPNKPKFVQADWKTNIQDTNFGKKFIYESSMDEALEQNNNVTYKYLWNVEVVTSKDKDSENSISSEVTLLQVYNGGRIPRQYISYYAGSATASAPVGEPILDADNNSIQELGTSDWKKADEYTGSDDDDVYLFEKTFVEYTETDEEGKNQFALIDGPTLIGRNGKSPVVLSLDNDSDVIAVTANGKIVGQVDNQPIITVNAKLTKNGQIETTLLGSIEIDAPDNFKLNNDSNITETDGLYTFANGVLNIYRLPQGFSSGNFVFSYSNLSATFGLRTVQSNADYDLVIDKTLINNTLSGGPISIKVRQTKEDGTIEEISSSDEVEVWYAIGTGELVNIIPTESGWSVLYSKYDGETPNTYAPIKVELRQKTEEGKANGFLWDWETIEFVQNGVTPQDFNVTASAYAFVKNKETQEYAGYITLKAHATNIGKVESIEWYENSVLTEVRGETYTATKPGLYGAKLGDWEDSVLLGEVTDGASGKDAVVILLSNPSMTFNKGDSETQSELSEIVVMEGSNVISYCASNSTNKPEKYFTAYTTDTYCEITEDGKVKVSGVTNNGTASISVNVYLNDEVDDDGNPVVDIEKTLSLNWTIVRDGTYVYSKVEPASLHKGSLPNWLDLFFYQKEGDKSPESYSPTGAIYYNYSLDNVLYDTFIPANEKNNSSWEIKILNSEEEEKGLQGIPRGEVEKAKTLKINIYEGDDDAKVLIDKATIEILADGENGSGVKRLFESSDISYHSLGEEPNIPLIGKPVAFDLSSNSDNEVNSGIGVDDSVYYIANISDQLGEGALNRTVTIYGQVTEYTQEKITIEVSSVVWDVAPNLQLILDNDSDVVVKTNEDKWLLDENNPVSTTVRAFIGSSHYQKAEIDCIPSPENRWVANSAQESGNAGKYTYDSSKGELTITQMPGKLTNSEGGGEDEESNSEEYYFTFAWTQNGIEIKKKFSLKTITSMADYDLVIPQTVYNVSNSGATIKIQVLTKSKEGTKLLSEHQRVENDINDSFRIYERRTIGSGETAISVYKLLSNWSLTQNSGDTTEREIVLASGGSLSDDESSLSGFYEFSTEPEVVWDEEIIEFVKDGTNGTNGQSVTRVAEYFLISSSNTPQDSWSSGPSQETSPGTTINANTWYNAPVEPTSAYPYLWNWEKSYIENTVINSVGPMLIGRYSKDGTSAYTLSLDNNYDTVVYTTDGRLVSTLPTVKATKYSGSSKITAWAVFMSHTDNVNGTGYFTYSNQNQSSILSPPTLQFNRLPDGFEWGKYTFTWQNGSSILDSKTFTLRKINSIADYDLVFPKTTYNTKDAPSTISFTVLKKTDTTVTLDSPPTNNGNVENEVVAYYKKTGTSGNTYKKIANWSEVSVDELEQEGVSVVLTSADGTLNSNSGYSSFRVSPNIFWDEETIEFVQDGTNAKIIRIVATTQQIQCDSNGTPKSGESCTLILQGSNVDTDDAMWYKNDETTSIGSGNTLTFRTSWFGESDSVKISAKVDSLTDIVSIVKNKEAASPYTLSLTNDFAVVGATAAGAVDDTTLARLTQTQASLSFGDIPISNAVFDWSSTGGKIKRVNNNSEESNTITNAQAGDVIYLSSFNSEAIDGALIEVSAKIQKDGATSYTSVAKKTFPITKNKQGDSAVSYQLKIEPNKVKEADFDANGKKEVEITVLKHEGGTTENITSGFTVEPDMENNKYYVSNNQKTFKLFTGTGSNKVLQDIETVEIIPRLYDYKAFAEPASLKLPSTNWGDIAVSLKKTDNGQYEDYSGIITCYIGENQVAATTEPSNSITIPKGRFVDKNSNFDIIVNVGGKLFDIVTIPVLKDGEDGETVWVLYHDAMGGNNDIYGKPSSPTNNDYNSYPEYGKFDINGEYPKTGWYRDQQADTYDPSTNTGNHGSVFSCQKVATRELQSQVQWGPVQRISPVVTSRYDILKALDIANTEGSSLGADDGIYPIDDARVDGTKKRVIGIRATAISAGAISVGGTPKFDQNDDLEDLNGNIFYANMDKTNDKGEWVDRTPKHPVLIAGWEVTSEALQRKTGNNVDLYLGTTKLDGHKIGDTTRNGLVFKAGNNFGVTQDGTLYATNGDFSGKITAKEGYIADWEITSGALQKTNNSGGVDLYLGTAVLNGCTIGSITRNNLVFKAGDNFGVDSGGGLYATSGVIAGWEITSGALQQKINNSINLYLGTTPLNDYTIGGIERDGLVFKAGDNFGVTQNGALYASAGNIAGWTIGMNTGSGQTGGYIRTGNIGSEGSFHMYSAFYDGNPTIGGHSDGSWRLIIGPNFGVNNTGQVYVGDLSAIEKQTAQVNSSGSTQQVEIYTKLGSSGLQIVTEGYGSSNNANYSGSLSAYIGAIQKGLVYNGHDIPGLFISTAQHNGSVWNSRPFSIQTGRFSVDSYGDQLTGSSGEINLESYGNIIMVARNNGQVSIEGSQLSLSTNNTTTNYTSINMTDNDIIFSSSMKRITLSELVSLGFKGPYNITLGGYVIGQAFQQGGVVCFKFVRTAFSFNNSVSATFDNISPPPSDITGYEYGFTSNVNLKCNLDFKNVGGKLQITARNMTTQGAPTYISNFYFCYSTKNGKVFS